MVGILYLLSSDGFQRVLKIRVTTTLYVRGHPKY